MRHLRPGGLHREGRRAALEHAEAVAVTDYRAFVEAKTQLDAFTGFEPVWIPDFLFDFQQALVEWSLRIGKGAIFADCGLGKTPMQLVWAENVRRHANKPVLVLTPLAVAAQTVQEGAKFGVECWRSNDGRALPGVTVTNYEKLHYFNPDDFAGVVCDESSILKDFEGVRRAAITDFMRKVRYRLLCTATAAPNDYIELGTSSEALGYLGHTDMLTRFFKADTNTIKASNFRRGEIGPDRTENAKWRFKGHAEEWFWRWVCSWARAVRRPSDLGFEDGAFVLPELLEREHIVAASRHAEGMLFALPAVGLQEQREERRRTLAERCERVGALVAETGEPAMAWCHLNEEGDLLERLIPGAVQVSGSDPDEAKEEKFLAFQAGQARVLVTKPKIGAWGLNFQHCAHVTFFPSHSFEQYYQAVRRCWRFGQKRRVRVDVVATEGERDVLANLQRKARAADKMFGDLVHYMNDAAGIARGVPFTKAEQVPAWL
jgi:hypothetical protein